MRALERRRRDADGGGWMRFMSRPGLEQPCRASIAGPRLRVLELLLLCTQALPGRQARRPPIVHADRDRPSCQRLNQFKERPRGKQDDRREVEPVSMHGSESRTKEIP